MSCIWQKKAKNEEELNELVQEYCLEKDRNGDLSPIYEEGPIPGLGRDAVYNENIFKTKEGEFSEVFQNKNGNYIFVKVTSLTPKTYSPIKEVTEILEQKISRKKQKEYFENLKERIKNEYSLILSPKKLEKKLQVDSLFTLAEAAMKRNSFQEALINYDQIIKYYPNGKDDYKAKFMKGFIFSEYLKKPEKATKMFEAVLQYPESKDHELHESARYMLKSLRGEENILDKINQNSNDESKEKKNK